VERIYLPELGIEKSRSRLIGALDEGVGQISYVGHAGLTVWAEEGLLTSADVDQLAASGREPVVTMMTCLAGHFGLPWFPGLGEALVRKDQGGAVAVWAPTGLSRHDQAVTLAEGYYAAAFGQAPLRLGDAVAAGRRAYRTAGGPAYSLETYPLLGDPAMWLVP
jgi:hypothetical protein